jgi:hypothetical protein
MLLKILLQICNKLGNPISFTQPTLVTIGLSHFSEKSRWLLDLSPLVYVEDQHLPAFHLSRTLLDLIKLDRFETIPIERNVNSKFPEEDVKVQRRKEKTGVPKLILPANFQLRNGQSLKVPNIVKNGSHGITQFLMQQYPQELSFLYPRNQLSNQEWSLFLEIEEYLEKHLPSAVTTYTFGCLLLSEPNASKKQQHAKMQKFIQNITNQFSTSPTPSTTSTKSKKHAIPATIERYLFQWLGSSVLIPLMKQNNHISQSTLLTSETQLRMIFRQLDSYYHQFRALSATSSSSSFSSQRGNPHQLSTSNISQNHETAAHDRFFIPSHSSTIIARMMPSILDILLASYAAPLLTPPIIQSYFGGNKTMQYDHDYQRFFAFQQELLDQFVTARNVLKVYEVDRYQ